MVADEANNVYITSWDFSTNPMQIIKYDAAGNLQWTASSPLVNENAHGRIFYKNGFLYRTGGAWMTVTGKNIPVVYTQKYNASTGALVWATTYYHADKISQVGWDLVVDATGNVYVAASVLNKSGKNQNGNWVTLKYNSAGTQQWAVIYDGNGNDIWSGSQDAPNAITMTNDGNIVVTGTSYTTTGQFSSQDMTTIKYSPAGSQIWIISYDNPLHKNDGAFAIATDASSNVYITGTTGNYPNDSVTTIKYSATGSQVWLMNYVGHTQNIRVDNIGNVYVGAETLGFFYLIKYSQGASPIANKQINPGEEINLIALKLYPNPAINQITLRNSENKMLGSIIIYDAAGKMVYQKTIGGSQTMIDIKSFSAGIYYLKSDQLQATIKFVKQ